MTRVLDARVMAPLLSTLNRVETRFDPNEQSGGFEKRVSYSEAIRFLCDLRVFGARFGLENTFRLAEMAGNPQDHLRFIHVAGTNGKGSVCAMLESIYRAAGLRVGLFTSPHLVNFAERIQVGRKLISEAEVVRLVGWLQPFLREFPPGHEPTFFEAVTLMALRYFADQRCDLVIWETGLGGRLDATNIVTPMASVITNIGIEHAEWLGDTHEKIATEKAGIIKPGIPAITAAAPGEGLEVILLAANEKRSRITVVQAAQTESLPLKTIRIPLAGPHQRLNAATALATVHELAGEIQVSDDAIRKGLQSVSWPGRMQRVKTSTGQVLLLDGAHNSAGAEALRVALSQEFPGVKPAMIFGVFRDKDSSSMCRSLAPLAKRVVLTPVHSERTEDPARLVSACRQANPTAEVKVSASLAEALKMTRHEPFVVIAGSLYLVGEAMELLHLALTGATDEKPLNEWRPSRH